MPRKTRRFGNLLKQYRGSGGTADATSRVGKFGNWLTGKTKIDVKRRPNAVSMVRQRVKVVPFGISPEGSPQPSDYFLTAMTGQARAIYNGIGENKSVFGLQVVSTVADTAGASTDESFYPALARIFVIPTGANTIVEETSAVTGDKYKRILGRSGSIPFGRSIASEVKDAKKGTAETAISNVDELDVAKSILNVVKADNQAFKVKTVTFVPEQFKPDKTVPLAPTTVPTLSF
jgi:hypothetical protein